MNTKRRNARQPRVIGIALGTIVVWTAICLALAFGTGARVASAASAHAVDQAQFDAEVAASVTDAYDEQIASLLITIRDLKAENASLTSEVATLTATADSRSNALARQYKATQQLKKQIAELQVHHAGHHRKWPHSHAAWDWAARWTLRELGASEHDVAGMMWIHHREGGPNSRNKQGTATVTDDCLGGWQLNWSKAHGHAWWSPVWSTKRAYAYVLARYGSVDAAVAHKRAQGWY